MFKKMFILRDQYIRDRCEDFIQSLPKDALFKVMITEYRVPKSRIQEEKYHAMIGDITPHFEFMGHKDWSLEDVKRLLIDAFVRVRVAEGRPLHQANRVVPSLDGSGAVYLGAQSRQFTEEEASEFIEFLHAYGSELNVEWKS